MPMYFYRNLYAKIVRLYGSEISCLSARSTIVGVHFMQPRQSLMAQYPIYLFYYFFGYVVIEDWPKIQMWSNQ